MRMRMHMHMHMRICMRMRMCTFMFACIGLHVYVRVCLHVYVRLHVFVCACACIRTFVYTYDDLADGDGFGVAELHKQHEVVRARAAEDVPAVGAVLLPHEQAELHSCASYMLHATCDMRHATCCMLQAELHSCACYMVQGTRYMVHGTWYKVHGTWYMVHVPATCYMLHAMLPPGTAPGLAKVVRPSRDFVAIWGISDRSVSSAVKWLRR